MSISEKLITVAENQKKVFDAGKKAQKGEFWNVMQQNGTRTNYMYAFSRWSCEYIRPDYKVVPTEQGLAQVFYGNPKLKKVEAEYFDFSCIPYPASVSYGNYYTFQYCYELEEVEDIGLSTHSYTATFNECKKLHTIEKLRSSENTTFSSSTFNSCFALENLTVEGVIGQNGFDVHWSEKLTHDSLMSIIKALKNYSDSSEQWAVTLGTANLNKLSDAEKAIATDEKGWTLA